LKIAREERVDPSTISAWLRKTGVEIKQGQHFVKQPPLRYSSELLDLVSKGPNEVQRYLIERIWGIQFSKAGLEQLEKFCGFVGLYSQGAGVEEIAQRLGVHRSTVAEWRNRTDQPYLIKTAAVAVGQPPSNGWKLIPLSLESGGNVPTNWIQVPSAIANYEDLVRVVEQVKPLNEKPGAARSLAIASQGVQSRMDLVGYLLGIMLGDAGKPGGIQDRFTSMNLDLQLTEKEPSNERIGELVCICAENLGIRMRRAEDKMPSGTTLHAREPVPAYRWLSARSPLIAWLFNAGLGLKMQESTSVDQVRMNWILSAPLSFLKRFAQGLADSDGTVRDYIVEIASMPNAEFVTKVLRRLGMGSARTMFEKGKPVRTSAVILEASALPIFSEFARGYRYELLMARREVLNTRTKK
jgi:transposase-like protein